MGKNYCTICNNSKITGIFDSQGFGGNSTLSIYLCDACEKSMERALENGVHVPSVIWTVKRMKNTVVRALKGGIVKGERE